MSDIHIGKSAITGDQRVLTVYFHIPITIENYPGGQVSKIESQLEQGDIDALDAGTLYEHETTFRKNKLEPNNALIARLKNRYTIRQAAIKQRLAAEYKFYGQKIEVI